MNIVCERLHEAMHIRNKKQVDLVRLTGIGKSSISTYLAGEYEPKQRNLYKLAKALNVNVAWLSGEDVPMEPAAAESFQMPHPDVLPITKRRVPILGTIAAGQPIYADEEFDVYAVDGASSVCDFALRVSGDSMEPRFSDGDIVFFRAQDDVQDGQIAAVVIDDTATLKHLYHLKNGVQLVSDNPKYPPMIFDASNSDSVRILGLAVGYYRSLY